MGLLAKARRDEGKGSRARGRGGAPAAAAGAAAADRLDGAAMGSGPAMADTAAAATLAALACAMLASSSSLKGASPVREARCLGSAEAPPLLAAAAPGASVRLRFMEVRRGV